MRTLSLVLAAALAMVGGIWIGQGIGVLPGSFMTSDLRWAGAGVVLIVVAAILLWSARRRPGA